MCLSNTLAHQVVSVASENFRHIVRIAGTDLDGSKMTVYALADIKGIGVRLASIICKVLNLDPERRLGFISDSDVKRIEDVINNPQKYGIPSWMFNRQKDQLTGENKHLIGADLVLAVRQDIDLMIRMRSWKGIRHMLGLKVRGQRTRTTGRMGQTVGVTRRK